LLSYRFCLFTPPRHLPSLTMACQLCFHSGDFLLSKPEFTEQATAWDELRL
jgi:hypothetical protein